jgi:hypothetical protein
LKGWPYPFPLLAYLHPDGRGNIAKYIYESKHEGAQRAELSIEEWIDLARANQLVRYRRGQFMEK